MFLFLKLTFLCCVIILTNPIFCQQFYDKSNCTSQLQLQGSNYICNSNNLDCDTFIVYRAQPSFNTISSIASLFNITQSDILTVNNLSEEDSTDLSLGREVIIPASCHCLVGFSQTIFTYNFSSRDSVTAVACGVFEGLVKSQRLVDENPDLRDNNIPDSYLINVHIQCACPDLNQQRNRVKFLLTYPVMEGDHTGLIASKFQIPEEMIWDANNLRRYDAIFPKTTLLVPTMNVPEINWNISSIPNNSPGPKELTPLRNIVPAATDSIKWNSQVFLGAGVCIAVVTVVTACGVLICNLRKHHPRNFQPLSARSSVSSNVSPDFLDGMSKLKRSLIKFSLEELEIASQDFDKESRISPRMYQGKIGGSYLTIEQMDSEEIARNVISILTKINHFNIVKLEGFCDGSKPYLVFEYAENGSLWDCLSNLQLDRQLTWARRMQIAFDIAAALHYLHNSTAPAFVHHNITTKNVLINTGWRAKISGFSLAKPVFKSEEKETINSNKSVILTREENFAHEYLTNSQVALKVDIFAFGVVLLELLSAKQVIAEGKILKNSVYFLLDKELVGSSKFLQKLKEFMDPILERDYPWADAMCLILLAKSCIEENSDHRPTMNDVMIALSRVV